MPTKVSVVIPVYNAESTLGVCLDSLLAQSLTDLEIICVDDGSTDGSPGLLRAYAQRDPRISIISQPNGGAGSARNAGLDRASGAFCVFLDADDFFEPTLAEKLCLRAGETGADIVICEAVEFDDKGVVNHLLINRNVLPDQAVFSAQDIPDDLFNFCWPSLWIKLYRRDFLIQSGIRFQRIHNANDLFFNNATLASAAGIAILTESLVHYRTGSDANLQSKKTAHPLDFITALIATRDYLAEKGMLERMRNSFANMAASHCIGNLRTLNPVQVRKALFMALHQEYLHTLGLDASLAYRDDIADEGMRLIRSGSFEAYMDYLIASLERDIRVQCRHISVLGDSIRDLAAENGDLRQKTSLRGFIKARIGGKRRVK